MCVFGFDMNHKWYRWPLDKNEFLGDNDKTTPKQLHIPLPTLSTSWPGQRCSIKQECWTQRCSCFYKAGEVLKLPVLLLLVKSQSMDLRSPMALRSFECFVFGANACELVKMTWRWLKRPKDPQHCVYLCLFFMNSPTMSNCYNREL